MKINTIKIVITYLVASLIWIMIGPVLVDGFSALFGLQSTHVELYKGTFFVLFTGVVLYFTILRQQRLLSASEKHYKSLFYANPTPLFICDQRSFMFIEVNTAAVKDFGYSLNDLTGMTIFDLFVDKKELIAEPVGEWQMKKKNGQIIIAHINSHQMQAHGQDCLLIMANDISAEIDREETLKLLYGMERELKEELEQNIKLIERSLEEKERLAEVIDRIHNVVMITDPDGIIIWVNRAFSSVTGYAFDEVIGRFPDFLHGPHTDAGRSLDILEEIKKNDFTSLDILNYNKAGEEYWVSITVSAVYNEQREVIRYISVENVITDKKHIEERLRQQNEVLKKLAWTNSHAIRKPVVSILSLVELCKETFDVAELKKFNAMVEMCARELDDITREVGKEINENDTIS